MAQEKISELTAVVTPALTDIFPVVQAGEVNVLTRKETLQQVLNLINANADFSDRELSNLSDLETARDNLGIVRNVFSVTGSGAQVLPAPTSKYIALSLDDANATAQFPPMNTADSPTAGEVFWFTQENAFSNAVLDGDGDPILDFQGVALSLGYNEGALVQVVANGSTAGTFTAIKFTEIAGIPKDDVYVTNVGPSYNPVQMVNPLARLINFDPENANFKVGILPAMNDGDSVPAGEHFYIRQASAYTGILKLADTTTTFSTIYPGQLYTCINVDNSSANGSVQIVTGEYDIVYTGQTSDATVTTIYSFPVQELECITLSGIISGSNTAKSDSCGGNFTITARRASGGNVTLIGSAVVNVNSTSSATFTCDVDTSTQSIRVRVTGLAATTYDWKINANYIKV